MACSVNVPISDIVEVLKNDHLDTFVNAILAKLNVEDSDFVKLDGGTATNLTIRGSLLLDSTAKKDLCDIVKSCTNDSDCGCEEKDPCCEEDKHTNKFYIDKTKGQIIIELSDGTRFSISKAELVSLLGDNSGKPSSVTLEGNTLVFTYPDGSTTKVDLSPVNKNTYPVSGEVVGTDFVLKLNDGTTVSIDASKMLSDTKVSSGRFDGTNLVLTNTDRSEVTIPFTNLPTATDKDTKPTGLTTEGDTLKLTLSDGSSVQVSLTDLLTTATNNGVNIIENRGYTLKTENNHYTTQSSDFNCRTIIRANRNGDQTITVTKPDESYIGKSLIIRKTSTTGTTSIRGASGVTISPADISPLRRTGNTVTLVYVGNGEWDAFGELP